MLALVMKNTDWPEKRGYFFVNKCFKQVRMCLKNKETRIIKE